MEDSPAPPKSGRSIRSPAQLEVLAKARAKAREVSMAKKRERETLLRMASPNLNLKSNLKRFLNPSHRSKTLRS